MRARGMLLVGIALGALGLAASSASADTLDQQQTDTSTNGYIVGPALGAAASSAETFTAGLSGGLDRADLFLSTFGANPVAVTVEIRDTSSGTPSNNVLASGSIPAASVGSAPGAFVPVAFSSPATVQAGTQYAIVAYTGGSNGYKWWGANGTPYGGGHGFSDSHSPPTGWLTSPVTFAFRTYVNPAGSPSGSTSGPTGQRAAALAKCKHKHGKKRKKCKKRANLLPV